MKTKGRSPKIQPESVPPKREISSLDELADIITEALERRLANAPKKERDRVTRELTRIADQVRPRAKVSNNVKDQQPQH